MPRVVHFEFGAEKPARAVKFYEKVFGWNIQKWEGPAAYWLISTGDEKEPGINGGMGKKEDIKKIVNTIDVPSLDEYMKKVKASGGKITAPKQAVPGVGWMCYFKDPEGNQWGMMQADKSAK